MKNFSILLCLLLLCSCFHQNKRHTYQTLSSYYNTEPSLTPMERAYKDIRCDTDKFLKTISCHYHFSPHRIDDDLIALTSISIIANSQSRKISTIYTSTTTSSYVIFTGAYDIYGKSIEIVEGPLLGSAELKLNLAYYQKYKNKGTEIRIYSSQGHIDVEMKDYEIQAILKYIKDNFKL